MLNTKTNKTPTVSVVITCYNYAEYICQAIDSVLNQTFDDFEIIIVNDGSTDNTEEVIQKYLSNDCIKYINQANAGQANAKNKGIKNSSGEFIAFLDADDWWETNKLQKQLKLFKDNNIGVVYSKSQVVDYDGKPLNWIYPAKVYSGNILPEIFIDNFIPFSSTIIRKECFEEVGQFDESLAMGIDWDLWLRISLSYEFSYANGTLLYYRLGHDNQMSKNVEERMRCSDRIMKSFIYNNPGILSKAVLNHAWSYTYCNRGEYYRNISLLKSYKYFCKAIVLNLINRKAYKGLIKNLFIFWSIIK